MLAEVDVVRYVTPLREGGSLPGLMEADDLGTYVVKFRGAGQGVKVLAAEVVAAGLARTLGLPVPDLVVVGLDAAFAAGEPDEEVQDLLRASSGSNLGVDFLPGALDADRLAVEKGADPTFAGRVLWFDAFVNNVDRTWRNPNMLWWGGRLWLIDHGASLTFHHNWPTADRAVTRPYDVTGHVMADASPDLQAATAFALERLTDDALAAAVAAVPDGWLEGPGPEPAAATRERYVTWLTARRDAVREWVPA